MTSFFREVPFAPTAEESVVVASPAKRPRSDSPDASGSSSPMTAPSYFDLGGILSSSPSASTGASTCLFAASIRSILCPSSSPIPSRGSSRRSSSGFSGSCKQVRFQRCTNASVFPALSSSEYDRTPIEPTCESESLDMPKRDNEGTEGWIKCVERARVAEKERKAAAAAAIAAGESPAPFRLTTTSHKVVEGVRGLVGGGYFVGGEERDCALDPLPLSPISPVCSSDSDSDDREGGLGDEDDDRDDDAGDEAMVVDDEEDGGESDHPVPPLTTDDSSSDAESLPSTTASDPPIHVAVVPVPMPFDQLAAALTPLLDLPIAPDAVASPARSTTPTPEETVATQTAAELERKRKCKERYGICALGKYSRAEVFQSYDSLGGF